MRKVILHIVLFSLLMPAMSIAQMVDMSTAEIVARNFYSEKAAVDQQDIVFENVVPHIVEGEICYYIFDVEKDNGFVIVSAEESYLPIIGYSDKGEYNTENQPEHIASFMNTYVEQIDHLRANPTKDAKVANDWKKYNVAYDNFVATASTKSVDPLVGHILWNQDGGWNALCPEDAAGPGGRVYAGCVATAMGIILKYYEYPLYGNGSHSYYIYPYGTQSVNYGEANYHWNLMDDENPNIYSAHLLYHLGVAVDMGYGPDGSGAYSANVPGALESYFGISTSATYVQKSNYTNTNWINLLKGQIDNDKPVYYSGQDSDGGHAFVCSGYDDSDNFHFNFGWSGSNNGFYTVYSVGGFNINQAAVINITPANSNDYPDGPQNLTAELDAAITDDFVVDVTWEAPATGSPTGYKIYRDWDEIGSVSASTFTFTDDQAETGNYYYSVRALYSSEQSMTVSDELQGLFTIVFFTIDEVTNQTITLADVTFNEETKPTLLTGAKFYDVPFGVEYSYTVEKDGYISKSGTLDALEDLTMEVYLTPEEVGVESSVKENFVMYPNPVKDVLNIDNVQGAEIIIYNIIGNEMIKVESANSRQQIDMSGLAEGTYLVKIKNNSDVIAKKVLITR